MSAYLRTRGIRIQRQIRESVDPQGTLLRALRAERDTSQDIFSSFVIVFVAY
jgi:hypothetical protein